MLKFPRTTLRRLLPALLLILLGAALRLALLGDASIWWDEGWNVFMARLSVWDMFPQTAADTVPPLSYLALHFWMKVAGQEEYALRFLTVLANLLTLALVYRIGADLGGPRAGLVALALFALARLPLAQSQQIRFHGYSTVFAMLAFWAAFRLWRAESLRGLWMLLVAAGTGLGLLNGYLAAMVPLCLNLAFIAVFLTRPDRWKLTLWWGASQALALLIVLPWLLFVSGRTPFAGVSVPPDIPLLIALYLNSLFVDIPVDLLGWLPLLLACAALLIAAAALALRQAGSAKLAPWLALTLAVLIPPAFIYLLFSLPRAENFTIPSPTSRYFVILAAAAYLLLGWGFAALPRRTQTLGLLPLLGLLGLSAWSLQGYYASRHLGDDYLSATALIQVLRMPGQPVIFNNDRDWPIWSYHYTDRHSSITNSQVIVDAEGAHLALGEALDDPDGFWLVQTREAAVTDPYGNIPALIASRGSWLRRYPFNELEVWFVSTQPPTPWSAYHGWVGIASWPRDFHEITAPISEGVELRGYFQPEPRVWSGGDFTVGLGYHVDQTQPQPLTVALHLLDSSGRLISESTVQLNVEAEGDHYLPIEVYIPPDMPCCRAQIAFVSGEHWQALGALSLRPRVSEWALDALPAGLTLLDAPFGDSIHLAAVELPDQLHAGEPLPLTLYWRTGSIVRERYKVFVHVVDTATGEIIAQQDQEPLGGLATTSAWLPGEFVPDSYAPLIPPGAAPGRYEIRVGLYEQFSGARLPTASGDYLVIGVLDLR